VEARELVKAHPGITVAEIAEKMGIKQNYLYRVLPGLAKDGLVVKDGRGWKPKDVA
jgi:DNA-binding IscR family transcriptional regulator